MVSESIINKKMTKLNNQIESLERSLIKISNYKKWHRIEIF